MEHYRTAACLFFIYVQYILFSGDFKDLGTSFDAPLNSSSRENSIEVKKVTKVGEHTQHLGCLWFALIVVFYFYPFNGQKTALKL